MTITARKYNPGFLSNDDLVANFCVRKNEYKSLLEALRECSGSANTHQIVIGPRGSGKTSLLLRVNTEIIRDRGLAARFFPVVFAEESYEVSTAGEFWLEGLTRLAEQVLHKDGEVNLRHTVEDLRAIQDDQTLEDRCLGALLDFADEQNRRIVLIVENLNMMFGDISDRDAGWRLRKILQTEPRIVLLASATSRFDQMSNPQEALYELFRTIHLSPLNKDDCAALWRTVSGRERAVRTIQALRILTGGSPRLLTILARFGGNLSFRELMADLLDLVDDHTEYFKSHLEALPPQERRVYLALAGLWKPASAREIAEKARLQTSQCSAQLTRLIDRGAVEVSGGSSRRKLYYLAECLYNIYYLMRRARGPAPLIDALVRFMDAYYSTDELKTFVTRMEQEVLASDGDGMPFCQMALERLAHLPSLKAHREEMLSHSSQAFADVHGKSAAESPASSIMQDLINTASENMECGRFESAIADWERVVQECEQGTMPVDVELMGLALIRKGDALVRLGRVEEALAEWDDVIRRFDTGQSENEHKAIAAALMCKYEIFNKMDRYAEALASCKEVIRRIGNCSTPELQKLLAGALLGRIVSLHDLNRYHEVLKACDEMRERFDRSGLSAFQEELAVAMLAHTTALLALNRVDDAIRTWSALAERCGADDSARIIRLVASGPIDISTA
ncbi:MAG: AAA family ATPase, partial [Rhodobacteraceae bacterium]|nr:AAA family ATPase [Paracoccaceae bacterium]